MQPSQGPTIIYIRKRTIPVREITRISHGAKISMINLGPTSPTIFNHLIINKIFPTKFTTFFPNGYKILQYGKKDGYVQQDPRNTYSSVTKRIN